MKITLLAGVLVLLALPALPQTNPTGTISGKVSDQQGLAVPGATVTATSPSLQGSRSTNTSANGDYIIPFLPTGDYSVTFELTGFATVKENVRVAVGVSVPLNATLTVSAATETVNVIGQAQGDFGQGAAVATSFKADLVEKLPLQRTFLSAALLTPGVENTGPNGGVTINGAMSFESLYVVNGVVVNENIRGQALNLFIEDALQETTTTTAAVSAEYGRFQGGVVQAITKSGGNEFSGSYRMTFDNDTWRAISPYPNDKRSDSLVKIQEVTLGGPILKDRLWFFGAGRFTGDSTTTGTTSFTNINFQDVRNQKRYEGKLTYALNANHNFRGAYTKIEDTENGNSFGTIMDLASLVNRATPQDLLSANYTGILSPKFFVEGQYSRRRFTFVGSGSQFTDLIKGTLLRDQSRGQARYNSPTFCGICDPETRDNQNVTAKATYFASTGSLGSHSVVFGFDMFDDKRLSNNHQSGSDFRILTTSAIIQGTGASSQIFPVLDGRINPNGSFTGTIIRWTPIFVNSIGNRFRTSSGYVNDAWTFDRHFSFNVGLRFDKNDGQDSQGNVVVKDTAFSPRVSATFDPKGNGEWTINASYGQYVAAIANSVGDAGSAGGQPATIDFAYLGPAVNVGNPANPTSTADALTTLFNWFNANGGTNRPILGSPSIPGLNTHINSTLKSPNSRDITLGVTRRLGTRGSVRVDGVYRKFHDFYATQIDLTTGRVSDKFGRQYDLGIVGNTDALQRSYKGLNFQISYRANARLSLGGNYTLSHLTGNYEGETGPSGPVTANLLSYPQYFDPTWNSPVGDLLGDVRHRARAWATWDVPIPAPAGSLNLSLLQYYSSGTPYGAVARIDTHAYVTNPGYLTPPSQEDYYFTARDAFHMDDLWRSDVAMNYNHKLGYKKAEVFFRGTIVNVFNRQGLTNFFGGVNGILDVGCNTGGCIDTTVLVNRTTASLAPFNPFTTTPVEGVNWRKAASFGKPVSRYAYQTPRTYEFSVGLRF
jgi:hypothetical protein